MDAEGSGLEFDKEKNIHTVSYKGKKIVTAVKKSDRHLIQLIKISNSNEENWHCVPPKMMHWKDPTSVLFLLKMHNLNIIMRKHQKNQN